MMIFFLEDYYEFGIYTKTRRVLEINGNGEINWDRTINNIALIVKDNIPYYFDLYTKFNINDLSDYFRLFHEHIVTTCSKRLEKAGLIELFDLTLAELSDKDLDDFGENDFILNKLEKEIRIEFNSLKLKLLKVMRAFLSEKISFTNENFLTVYGTSTYHVIWEEMCRKIFGDKLNEKLGVLMLNLNEKYDSDARLIDVIEKPKWDLEGKEFEADNTFMLDIITLYRDKFNRRYFVILDAKYYQIELEREKSADSPVSRVSQSSICINWHQGIHQAAWL